MQIHDINKKEVWNALVYENGPSSGAFLQSWEWGEFQRAAGKTVRRVAAVDEQGPVAAAQIVETALPFGMRYQFCPRGPLVRRGSTPAAAHTLLGAVARKTGSLLARFEPSYFLPDPVRATLQKTPDVSPAHSLVTDLTLTYDDLSRQQHSKTRYNVGLAERKGVTVQIGSHAFDEAWPLLEATAARGGFRLHPRKYYETMLTTLTTDACRAFLAVARYEGKVVAANVMVDFHGTRTYLHGASGNEHREVMAPYLLHWALIQEAKHQGLRAYDWWGVAPEGASDSHPWAGITRFKLGFGGRRVAAEGTFDLVVRPTAYRLYGFLRSLRRKLRIH